MQNSTLLLLLLLQQTSGCEHLACFADYIQTLTCIWRSNLNTSRQTTYELTATWKCGGNGECRLQPASWNATCGQYTCFSEQTFCVGNSIFNVMITTHTDDEFGVDSACTKAFKLEKNIRPHLPFNLTATTLQIGYNISWKTMYQHLRYHDLDGQLQYELRYRLRGRPWQAGKKKQLLQDIRTVWLLPQDLEAGAEYEFQVRAKPSKDSLYQGTWSDWSHPATLWTMPNASKNEGSSWQHLLLLGFCLTMALGAFLGWHKRLWKKLNIFIPSPAPFFQPLYTGHGGNFKTWVGACSRATLDIYEWSSVLLEVFHISQKPLSTSPAKGEWSSGQALSYMSAVCSGHNTAQEQAYGHLSIDTVTVSGEFAPCCPQCNSRSSCCALEAEEEGDHDAYRSIDMGDDSVGAFRHSGNQTSASSPLVNVTPAQRVSALEPWGGDPLIETGPALPQSGGFQGRKPEGDLERFGLLPLHLCGLEGLLPSEQLPPGSHLFLLDMDADGDPAQVLDLDTIDSGFADSDCGSPVACELERSSSGCGFMQGEEEAEIFLPSYVKQWISYQNKVQPSQRLGREGEQELSTSPGCTDSS